MLKGNLYITNDVNMVYNMIATSRVIIIGQPDTNFVNQTGASIGSILLPPYNASMCEMDGDINSFVNIYTSYLSNIEQTTFIAHIIKALYEGINLVFYLSKDESELMYSKVLLQYLEFYYGIKVGTVEQPFVYYNTPEYNSVICNLLYQLDLISNEEFFINYPIGIPIDNNSIVKLIREINPYINDTSFESYVHYFNNYKEMIKQNNNLFLSNPISRRR